MACTCLHCALWEVINERFPDGVGPEKASEIGTNLATLSGTFLSGVSDRSVEAFVAAMREHRDYVRQRAGVGAGGLH